MAVEVYLYDTRKRLRRAIVWGISKLVHDERDFMLTAQILNAYAASPGEFLGFRCADERYRLFEIEKAAVDPTGGYTTITATEAAVAELAHKISTEVRFESAYADEAAAAALAGSGFVIGKTARGRAGEISKYYATRWKVLREIEAVCNVRILPYFTIENGQITGKVVDIEEHTYRRTGRILQRETDATNVQIVYSGIPITRMYGVGKMIGTEDPPTRVTFADVVWSKASGDPLDKPAGLTYLEDPDAIAQHGDGREAVYENKDITDANELIRATHEEFERRKKPQVSGVATAFDVEHIPGYEHKAVRMYDILDVPTDDGGTVEGKVIDIQRNYLRPELTQIVLGEESESAVSRTSLAKQVAALSSEAVRLGGSSGAASSRYLENKHLIQLNANRIVMNAEEITANAERISLTASNLERYKAGTDEALNEVGIRLDAYDAELLLYAKQTTVDNLEKEVYIRLDAAEEEIELKANKVDLGKYATVERLEAEISDVKITDSSYVTTAALSTQSLDANYVQTNSFNLGGHGISLKSTDYVKSVGRTKRYVKSPSDITVEIWEISSISNGTMDYLSY